MTHAKLQPSAAARWMKCPGSVRMAAAVDDPGDEDTDQGTACHMLLARRLRGEDPPWQPDEPPRVTVIDEGYGRVVAVEVTPEMLSWVDAAASWVDAYLASNPSALLRVEALSPVGRCFRVNGRATVDELYGHSDIVLVTTEELVVVDAKFGRVEVTVEENPQVSLYTIGHAEEYGWTHERYKLAVLQPRSPQPVKVEQLTRQQLRERAERYSVLVAEALQPDARLVPGDHCAATYCPAAGVCRALRDRSAQLAKQALRGAQHLNAAELAEVLNGAKLVRKALAATEAHALGQLAVGTTIPGWKRVRGEGHRKWTNEAVAAKLLQALGLDPWKKTLLSPNQAEEALGEHGGLLTPYAPKAASGPVLARADDPRPALEADSEAFDDEDAK